MGVYHGEKGTPLLKRKRAAGGKVKLFGGIWRWIYKKGKKGGPRVFGSSGRRKTGKIRNLGGGRNLPYVYGPDGPRKKVGKRGQIGLQQGKKRKLLGSIITRTHRYQPP